MRVADAQLDYHLYVTEWTRFLHDHDQFLPFLVATGLVVAFVITLGFVAMKLHRWWVYHRMIRERNKELSSKTR